MAEFQLREGEEILTVRRKTNVVEENGEKREIHTDTLISKVRVPYDLIIVGGLIDVNWETTQHKAGPQEQNFSDQRFFIIKYLTR